jgi:Cu/Ag efflux protein CusF
MAQQKADDHSAHHAAAGETTEAEVRKVDKEAKKITLKHAAIKNLDMPPMTMVFGVSDAALLDKVQAGDKIRFRANGDGGKFTVTEIQPVK